MNVQLPNVHTYLRTNKRTDRERKKRKGGLVFVLCLGGCVCILLRICYT